MSLASPHRRPRRVWVRLAGRTPTSFHVSSNDLIDDLKYMVTNKFPNSIKSHYDAADLVIKVPVASPNSPKYNAFTKKPTALRDTTPVHAPSPLYPAQSQSMYKVIPPKPTTSPYGGSTPISMHTINSEPGATRMSPVSSTADNASSKPPNIEIQPDSFVWTVMDMYFPDGQTMQNAFIIDISDAIKERDEIFIKDNNVNSTNNNNINNNVNTNNNNNSGINSSANNSSNPNSQSSSVYNSRQVSTVPESFTGNMPTLTLSNNQGISAPIPTPAINKSHLTSSKVTYNRNVPNPRESATSPFGTPSHPKLAVIGDSKVPPPRFRNQSLDANPAAIIMFPGDGKNDKKAANKLVSSFTSRPIGRSSTGESGDKRRLALRVDTSSNNDEVHESNNRIDAIISESENITNQLSSSAPTSSLLSPPSAKMMSATSSVSMVSNSNTITPTNDGFNNSSTVTLNNNGPITSSIPLPLSVKPKLVNKAKLDHRIHPLSGVAKILNHLNVLVVEDNLVNQKIMARHLKSCNVQFDIAKTGKEALEMWKQGGFHLCFMDIQLPVMSGIEVTKEIRRLERLHLIGQFAMGGPRKQDRNQDGKDERELQEQNTSDESHDANDYIDVTLFRSPIIIVALTASSSVTDQEDALAAGCNDFLTKPVQLKWLKNKLTEWGCMQALINYDYFTDEH